MSGVFAYSIEEGTRAADMEGQWDESTKLRRKKALLMKQRKTAGQSNQRFVGNVTDVLLESVTAGGKGNGTNDPPSARSGRHNIHK